MSLCYLPTAYVVRGKVMFWHASVRPSIHPFIHPSVCLSTPGGGGGVPQPGPDGGGEGTSARSRQGVPLPGGYPTSGTLPVGPGWGGYPCQGYPTEGVPLLEVPHLGYPPVGPGRGVHHLRYPPSDLPGGPHFGYPHQTWLGRGVPHLRYPLFRPGGYTCQGVPHLGYPPHQTCRGWGVPLPEGGPHPEYLIRRGRYASCVHAGGLSCFNLWC